jgi:hypothetical protein
MKLRGGTASPSAQKLIDHMAALAQRGPGGEP